MDADRRLFLALALGPEARQGILEAQGLLAPHLARSRPTAPDDLHLTLAFLGECDRLREGLAADALAAATAVTEPFEVVLGGLGSFDGRRGSVIWRGVAATDGRHRLMGLQARLVGELSARGVSPADRPFVPHVTLARGARLAPGDGPRTMADLCDGLSAGLAPLRLPVVDASLMWSRRPPGGTRAYLPLVTCTLGMGDRPSG